MFRVFLCTKFQNSSHVTAGNTGSRPRNNQTAAATVGRAVAETAGVLVVSINLVIQMIVSDDFICVSCNEEQW